MRHLESMTRKMPRRGLPVMAVILILEIDKMQLKAKRRIKLKCEREAGELVLNMSIL